MLHLQYDYCANNLRVLTGLLIKGGKANGPNAGKLREQFRDVNVPANNPVFCIFLYNPNPTRSLELDWFEKCLTGIVLV